MEIDLEHLAFAILHGTFDPNSPGGCSCKDCTIIREAINNTARNEAADYYNEHYPPVGGLL